MKLWGKALLLCGAGFFGSFASFYVHDSLRTSFPAQGALASAAGGGSAGTEEDSSRREQLSELSRQLFETNRQTQILQTELISRYDPSLDIPTLADLSHVKTSAIDQLPSTTAAQRGECLQRHRSSPNSYPYIPLQTGP